MTEITTTELERNLHQVLERVAFHGEELLVVRNHHRIARLGPAPAYQTALEAMADIYRTVPEAPAGDWAEESRSSGFGTRGGTLAELSNPWDS